MGNVTWQTLFTRNRWNCMMDEDKPHMWAGELIFCPRGRKHLLECRCVGHGMGWGGVIKVVSWGMSSRSAHFRHLPDPMHLPMKIGPDLGQDEKDTMRTVGPIQGRSRWEKGARGRWACWPKLTAKSVAGQRHCAPKGVWVYCRYLLPRFVACWCLLLDSRRMVCVFVIFEKSCEKS